MEDRAIVEAPRQGENMPDVQTLEIGLAEANLLLNDIVLKKYLNDLTTLEIVPFPEELKRIEDIRIFKITEMVYQKDEYSTYKFASVFNAVQNLNCAVFVIVDSDGSKTEFYMGIRAFDETRTPTSLSDTLKNALYGQFPGVKTDDLLEAERIDLLGKIPNTNIASVSCVANNKDKDFKEDKKFIQGLEKLALAMQGQSYTAVILARSIQAEELEGTRNAYQNIYTQLSPFANMQLSYGTNEAFGISEAVSHGVTKGTSSSITTTHTHGTAQAKGISDSTGESEGTSVGMMASWSTTNTVTETEHTNILKTLKRLVKGGVTKAMSSAVAQTIGINITKTKTVMKNHAETITNTINDSDARGIMHGKNYNVSDNKTDTVNKNTGTSQTMQLTMQNKTLLDNLERIGKQLRRMEECESMGMWESSAYFISDSQKTAEMAAGTYKALMRGTDTGLETAAINYWGHKDKKLPILREYVTNFVQPIFLYDSDGGVVPVTSASLVSGNELAIQMGLPRKSVCGFPVVEHADFGKEVVSYCSEKAKHEFSLGKVFNMGTDLNSVVKLDADSLAMHTFITGSTGAGKSNAVYEILWQLHANYNIPFLVIEPAKGEYKNILAQLPKVSVYGTNPSKSPLLRINPFSFPDDVHVLEHLDRLVEIFNVCWPMYAAMPAILKEAMEKVYEEVGWNLEKSENKQGRKYPNFAKLEEEIKKAINSSEYSGEVKGNYIGALLTRVHSLTTGLNGLIFTDKELSDEELYDKNVIVDLSRVGSTETKSLIMGLLVMKLNEHRMSCGDMNSPLKHITVLEEAHNLLKRVSTEQTSENSNLLGKSVELLANSIAEMRTYGEGFIIADQAPGLLDMSVIRNTNTKIILRLPDRGDRELVGYAAGLKEEQIDELSKLDKGVAAIYQNGWVEPVLVKINKCGLQETPYSFISDSDKIKRQLVNFLISGRMSEATEFSIDEIENSLELLQLNSDCEDCIKMLLLEFKQTRRLQIWEDVKFAKLSELIVELLEVKDTIKKSLFGQSLEEITSQWESLVLKLLPNASSETVAVLCQCFAKDGFTCVVGAELGNKLYTRWVKYINERGAK